MKTLTYEALIYTDATFIRYLSQYFDRWSTYELQRNSIRIEKSLIWLAWVRSELVSLSKVTALTTDRTLFELVVKI
jgi:hypothetical protein